MPLVTLIIVCSYHPVVLVCQVCAFPSCSCKSTILVCLAALVSNLSPTFFGKFASFSFAWKQRRLPILIFQRRLAFKSTTTKKSGRWRFKDDLRQEIAMPVFSVTDTFFFSALEGVQRKKHSHVLLLL